MKTEIVMSLASEGQQGQELAPLDKLARRFEDALDESVAQEDVVCAIVSLAVPDLADYCLVDVFDGEHPVCCVFAHRDPTSPSLSASTSTAVRLCRNPDGTEQIDPLTYRTRAMTTGC